MWPNRILHLVQGLSALQPTPRTPFLEPSHVDTYVIREHVNPGVEPNPTFRLVTQARRRGRPMVVQTWAPTKRAPTLKGPPRKACHSPPL